MQILKRITDNGVNVGYTIDEGGIILPMCKDAFYTELYIRPLTEAGYKYFSRNADEIEDPNGVALANYESIELSTLDSVEWLASLDLASTSVMSDAEASVFYTFREDAVITFKTEPSYEINTREEFMAYLKGLQNMFYNTSYSIDNRPINAFVNPEALFTIDELIAHPEYKEYFDIIVKRHHMRNWDSYQKLLKWLQEKGVLNTNTPTMAEFLAAYYAWGPEGLKDRCTNIETKLNVDGVFSFPKDPLSNTSPEDYIYANRANKVVVVDGNQGLHFLKSHEDMGPITDMRDFERSRIAIGSNTNIMYIRRMESNGYRYQAVKGALYSDVSDRLYITLLSDSGYTYVYKVAHNQMKLGLANTISNSSVFSSGDNFTLSSIVPSVTLPLDIIKDINDYYLWNLAIVKSSQLIKDRTYDTPHNSTADFLLADGVNPIAIIDMMAHDISSDNSFKVNSKYQLSTRDDDLNDALELYIQDIPDYILHTFGLTEEDLELGVESFLELADVDALRDRRDAMMEQRINPGDTEFDYTYKEYQSKFARNSALMADISQAMGRTKNMYDAIDYYTKLKFVNDCLHGALSINNFGDGQLADLGVSYKIAAECIMSVIYAEYGNTPNVEAASNAIINLENTQLIDIHKIFKIRDKALKGYMIDFANYRNIRGNEDTYIWAYCTKVFREISNAPVEKQRPYLMELVVLENSKPDIITRQLMTQLVKDAIEASDISDAIYGEPNTLMGNWNNKKCAEKSASFIAAKLFFYIYAGGIKTEPVDGAYDVVLSIYDSQDLHIKVPVEVVTFVKSFNKDAHKRYMTVFDYCKYEFNPNTTNGRFQMYVVNADIDPWHVKPKKGYSIKTYSLLPNYYEQNILDKVNGENYYLTAYNNKEICVAPLKQSYSSLFEPAFTIQEIMPFEEECKIAQDVSDLESYLSYNQHEFIFAYVRRWALERKKANNAGKKLLSIPLKQDIVFNSIAPVFCEEVPSTEAVYADSAYFDDKKAQVDTTVKSVSWRDFYNTNPALTTSKATLEPLSTADIEFDDAIELRDIIAGVWKSNVPIYVTGNYLNISTPEKMRVLATRLTKADLDNYAANGIIRQIAPNKYYLTAMNGDYVLTV